ncbi:hypothetical protein OJF2_09150 [Aquisphaera giovannonii]|uniref:DUF5615 domain-containing protein n=1 Tax=Aquisphaera giovannonii TaxID=406548 RepID=A0A5B9VWL1_9BACT|nr:hypothetical protein [Aquisphaera giovannonii]QEH32444.1 hypothetical protein OJF2_09150 [Aquisphaera giovannonii]
MNIQILIDMNLSPDWAGFLTGAGWPAVHWSTVGDPAAADRDIDACPGAERDPGSRPGCLT